MAGLRFLLLTAACGAISMLGGGVRAQVPAVRSDVRAARGLPISPVYEGWYEVDGKKHVLFAYYNRNLEEIVDVPIGPGNYVSPGPQDQGQPTRFFPGVYYGVFATALPKDQPTAEVTWTLTANGQTVSIPAFLDPLYFISPQREDGGAYPGNLPPVVKFDPAGASAQGPYGITVSRTATVGRPLTLDAWVTDDGLPPPRRESRATEGRRAPTRQEPPQGLALSWQVYRGAGVVTFSDQRPAVEEGKARTMVTFSQPGDYMLHLLAIDSRTANRCCWTNGYVKVKVEGPPNAPERPGIDRRVRRRIAGMMGDHGGSVAAHCGVRDATSKGSGNMSAGSVLRLMTVIGVLRPITVVVLAMAAVASPQVASAQASAAGSRPPTFTRDVAPILQEKCEVCHRPGNIGPMSLVTYEEVRPWVRSIKTRVANREMPPWHLDKGIGVQKFINDGSLSDAQIDTIVQWVDAGAPQGDMKDMPPAKQWPSGEKFFLEDVLGPPDLVVRAKPFTMPGRSPDVHFEVEVPLPLTEPRWVRASETKPSVRGRQIAHHATTNLIRPQTPEAIAAERAVRAGQAGADSVIEGRRSRPTVERESFTEWAQGKGGEIYPENVGKLVMPGTKAYFRIHYHAVGEEVTDTLEVGWWFHPKGKTPKYSAEHVTIGTTGPGALQIPPNTVTEHQGITVLREPTMLHNFQPHMHYRGKVQTLEAIYPDGRREVVNQVSRFTNTWHINYIYDPDYAPVFPKGTVLIVTTIHDNTSGNKNNPDPRQAVIWGDRTVDEMAHLNEQLIYITEEDYQRIVEERRKRASTQN